MAYFLKYCIGRLFPSQNETRRRSEKTLSRFRDEYSFSLSEVKQQINSNLTHLQVHAVRHLKLHISRDGSVLINAVVDAGLLPKLFEFLRSNNHDLVFEAISTLKYISFGGNVIGRMIDLENFSTLCNLLSSTRFDIVEQIIWLLGGILSFRSSNEFVDQLVDKILLISNHLEQGSSLIRSLVWTLTAVPLRKKKYTKDLLILILNLLRSPNAEPTTTVRTLIKTYKRSPTIYFGSEHVDKPLYAGIPGLIDFVILDDDDSSILALRAITLICRRYFTPSPILIQSTFLSTLFKFFNHPQVVLQHEVSICTSAIMCKSSRSAMALANSGLLQIINDKLLNSGDEELRMKCLWALALFLKIVPHKLDLILEFDVLHGVCNFIKHYSTTDDDKNLMILGMLANFISTAEQFGHLETTISIIRQSGGLDKLKEFQNYSDFDVKFDALYLDKKYFSPEIDMEGYDLEDFGEVNPRIYAFDILQTLGLN